MPDNATEVATATQRVLAAICGDEAVPIADLLDDLRTMADATVLRCRAADVPALDGADVEHCLRPAIALYGRDAVLTVTSDVALALDEGGDEACADDPDGVHHVGCGC
jgi:hypothetical protein